MTAKERATKLSQQWGGNPSIDAVTKVIEAANNDTIDLYRFVIDEILRSARHSHPMGSAKHHAFGMIHDACMWTKIQFTTKHLSGILKAVQETKKTIIDFNVIRETLEEVGLRTLPERRE